MSNNAHSVGLEIAIVNPQINEAAQAVHVLLVQCKASAGRTL